MHVQINQKLLLIGLQYIAHAASTKKIIPILSGINILADHSGLTLTAGDSGMMLQYKIPYHTEELIVHQVGGIVVPARYFTEIIRNLPTGSVKLESKKGSNLSISSHTSKYHLCGMDAQQYPRISEINLQSKLSFSNEHLRRLIKQVSFAVSSSETRPVLTGVMFEFNSDHIKLIATDGIRLSSQTTNNYITSELTDSNHIIIPGKHLSDYAKLLNDEHSSTEILLGNNKIIFKTSNLLMESSLLVGSFPSLDRIIPGAFTTEIVFDTINFLHALERVSLLAGESKVVKLQGTSTNLIELSSMTAEIGNVSEEISTEQYKGNEINLSFNGRYMIEIIRAIQSNRVTLKFSSAINPIIVQPNDDINSLYIITPIRSY